MIEDVDEDREAEAEPSDMAEAATEYLNVKLVVVHFHTQFYKQVDRIVTHVRRDVWEIKARKIASSIYVKYRIISGLFKPDKRYTLII